MSNEIEVQKALGTYLPLKWKEYQKLYAEGDKLRAEGNKLYAEGRSNLYAEGSKLCVEGSKLHAEAALIYINAVIEVYGPKVFINWNTGEVKV